MAERPTFAGGCVFVAVQHPVSPGLLRQWGKRLYFLYRASFCKKLICGILCFVILLRSYLMLIVILSDPVISQTVGSN